MEKVFSINPHKIGSVKYSLDYFDGLSKHKDGSPFIGVKTSKTKKSIKEKVEELKLKGYKEVSSVFNFLNRNNESNKGNN